MKKFIILFVLLFGFSFVPIGSVLMFLYAEDELELTSPAPICDDNVYKLRVRSYVIIPPPNGRIEVDFDMCNDAGDVMGSKRGIIDGTDFTDIVNFQIRTQDVGVKFGVGFKQLIWNKLRSKYSIDF